MENLFKNKSGGEKLLSIWWFFVIGIVGVGIVAGVLVFYSASFDTREKQSEILLDKISDCLIKDGFLIEGVLDTNFDVFEKCSLDKEAIQENIGFYFGIQFFDSENKKLRETIEKGVLDYAKECKFQEEGVKGSAFAKCSKKEISFSYFDGELIKIGSLKILTASNIQGERITNA